MGISIIGFNNNPFTHQLNPTMAADDDWDWRGRRPDLTSCNNIVLIHRLPLDFLPQRINERQRVFDTAKVAESHSIVGQNASDLDPFAVTS